MARRRVGHAPSARSASHEGISGALAKADATRRFVLGALGVGAVSLVMMVATLAARMSLLADWIPTHLNAEGTPDSWGTASTLWRIPLLVVMSTAMCLVVGWFAGRKDAFAQRFMIVSTLLIQMVAWVALLHLAR
ncbi:MAG: DUF1648 domain-containing protein [Thermomicrobiales bacterium]